MKVSRFKINTLDIDIPNYIVKITDTFLVEKSLYSEERVMEEFVKIDNDMTVISYNVPENIWKSKWSFLEKYSV